MKLLLNKETERELGASLSNANLPGITDEDLWEAGAEMTSDALQYLIGAGIDYELVHTQSVGAVEVVQSATDHERQAWDRAIDIARVIGNKRLAQRSAEPIK